MNRFLSYVLILALSAVGSWANTSGPAWPEAGGGGAASNYKWYAFSMQVDGGVGEECLRTGPIENALVACTSDFSWHFIDVPAGENLIITDMVCYATSSGVLAGGYYSYIAPGTRTTSGTGFEHFGYASPAADFWMLIEDTDDDAGDRNVIDNDTVGGPGTPPDSVTVATSGPRLLQAIMSNQYSGGSNQAARQCLIRAGW